MSARRFELGSVAVVTLIMLGGSAVIPRARGQATQPAANAAAADIELGKPPKYPTIITPTIEGGGLLDNHHGEAITLQEIVFDAKTHELSLPKTSPTKQRLYADSKIDSANYNTDLTLFDYMTTDRAPIGKIMVLSAKKKMYISPNYVVSPGSDKPKTVDPSTYRASVQFVKGDEANKPGTKMTVHRNADPATEFADTEFTKINRKTDVITWSIERDGAVVKTGSFGFPVVATAPDLVKYVVQLP